jgi:Predicted Zn-dependent protease (DUF2268)
MSLETRARAAATQANRRLATVLVPDPVMVVRAARRRRRVRTSIALVVAALGVTALAVPIATQIDRDDPPSVVGAPTDTVQPRDGKPFVVDIDTEAVEAAADVGVNLTRLTHKSLARIAPFLPDLERVVRVEVDPAGVIPQVGVGATTDPTSGEVVVSVDPDRMDPSQLRVWIPALLAHQAYSSVRVREGPGFGTTLGDRMVASGLADALAREVSPETPLPPWVEALTDEAKRLAWAEAVPILEAEPPDRDAADALYREWFQGAGGLPPWTGFTLGYEIVNAYLASHPDATAASLFDEPAESILAGSGYHPAPLDPNRPRCYTTIAQTAEIPCGDYEAMFAASDLVAEPGKCYVVSGFFVSEQQCVS